MTASGLCAAIRFLLQLRRPGGPPGDRRREVQRFDTAVDVYQPQRPARGTVVFIHGMAPAGFRDPRIVSLGSALLAAGFRAVIPDIPSIRELKIRRRQAGEVLDLLAAVAGDAALVPEGRLALMAVSFSGVFAVHAACRPALAARLSGLCLIGAYSDVFELCRFLIHSQRADPYGMLLIARSYYAEEEPETARFLRGLDKCIAGCIEHGEDWNPVDALDRDDPDEARVAALLEDPGRQRAFEDGLHRAFNDDWRDYRVPMDFARRDLPVLLIHGRGDRVIPAGESRRLAGHLGALGMPHRLCVTGVLTHGDSRLDIRRLLEIVRLARRLAWFFGAISAGRPGK